MKQIILILLMITNETWQEINSVDSVKQVPQDIIFSLDCSGSIDPMTFRFMLSFVNGLVWNMDIDSGAVRVAVLTLSDDPIVHISFESYINKIDLMLMIAKIPHIGGSTNFANTYQKLIEISAGDYGNRINVRDTTIFITDGFFTDVSLTEAASMITTLKSEFKFGLFLIQIYMGGAFSDMCSMTYPLIQDNCVLISGEVELRNITIMKIVADALCKTFNVEETLQPSITSLMPTIPPPFTPAIFHQPSSNTFDHESEISHSYYLQQTIHGLPQLTETRGLPQSTETHGLPQSTE
ncbi:unnamed protein product, partial [Owenia fusiformis]